MATLDDLKQSLHDLQVQVSSLESDTQARIDAAVQAQKINDQAGFDEAVGAVRAMVSSLATQASAVHQTATSMNHDTLSGGSAVVDQASGQSTPSVQTTQTATTDPTGTAATGSTLVNVPDGAMSTAAPGTDTDPATGATVDQVGSAAAPYSAGTTLTDLTAPNPPVDETVSGDEAREANPSAGSTVKTEPTP